MLKSSVGAAGHGLYFCHSPNDIAQIVERHRLEAESHHGFLASLRQAHDNQVPDWNLQAIVACQRVKIPTPLLPHHHALNEHSPAEFQRQCSHPRRCQLRAYLVACAGQLWLYEIVEAR
jgi:hypothetical protein